MMVRARMFILGGVLSCLLIGVEAQPVADSTRTDLKRSGIKVSSQRIGTGAGTVAQSIDIRRGITSEAADLVSDGYDGYMAVTAPSDIDTVGSYAIPWHSVNSGGALQIGAGGSLYAAGSSVAQSATGIGTSDSYEAGTGYWYGTDTTSVVCACDCHADPACDGMTNVLDVVMGVNVAFRGGELVMDPNPLCPYEDTDVDCSGFTDVIDVVKLVNVAFRGGLPSVNFSDPCL